MNEHSMDAIEIGPFISVVSDEDFAAMIKAEEKARTDASLPAWEKLKNSAAAGLAGVGIGIGASSGTAGAFAAGATALGIGVFSPLVVLAVPIGLGTAGVATYVTAKSWWDGRTKGAMVVHKISRSTAKAFRFPQGGPKLNELYVQHPAVKTQFYPIESFHRLTFEHKLSEAVRLLMFLGAKSIRAEYVSGWSKAFAAKASIDAPGVKLAPELSSSTKESESSSILFEASYPNNTSLELPKNMVWFQDEPTWEAIAEGRLIAKATEVQLKLSYEEDFGVNAEVKVAAEKAGFSISGDFVKHKATTWNLHALF
jgi:hypothetical protein